MARSNLILLVLLISCGVKQRNEDGRERNTEDKDSSSVGKWIAISSEKAPSPRYQSKTIWTGEHFIVFSGYNESGLLSDGGVYHLASDSWEKIPELPSLPESYAINYANGHLVLWGGSERSGGEFRLLQSGFSYHLASKQWSEISTTGAPSARYITPSFRYGNRIIFWGGHPGCDLTDGGVFDPEKDSWTPIPKAPVSIVAGCDNVVIVGDQMVVWGGYNEDDEQNFSGFASFDLSSLKWREFDSQVPNYPGHREWPLLASDPENFVVWGGYNQDSFENPRVAVSDGSIFDISSGTWNPIKPLTESDVPMINPTTIIVGSALFAWGGVKDIYFAENEALGAVLDLKERTWTPLTSQSAPRKRSHNILAEAKNGILVWGGSQDGECLNDGAIYDLGKHEWKTVTKSPFGSRTSYAAAWAGNSLIVWGGKQCLSDGAQVFSDGWKYTL